MLLLLLFLSSLVKISNTEISRPTVLLSVFVNSNETFILLPVDGLKTKGEC